MALVLLLCVSQRNGTNINLENDMVGLGIFTIDLNRPELQCTDWWLKIFAKDNIL